MRRSSERNEADEDLFLYANLRVTPETVLEDELFGHRMRAFTQADEDRDGLFVADGGGTVFLDEVDMSAKPQAAVLRVPETKELKPIDSDPGSQDRVPLIRAAHRDLVTLKQEGGAGRTCIAGPWTSR